MKGLMICLDKAVEFCSLHYFELNSSCYSNVLSLLLEDITSKLLFY